MVVSNARKKIGFLHISFYKVVQIVLPIIKRTHQNDFSKNIWFLLNIGVYLQCERGEGTVSPLIFVR